MARLGSLDLVARAEAGVALIMRDETAPVGANGLFPALLAADGTPATVTLLGVDSRTWKKQDWALRAKRENAAAAKSAGGASPVTADEEAEKDAENLDRMVAMVKDWHGFEDDTDAPVPFTADAVRALFTANPTLYAQATLFVYRRADFFARAKTPSAPALLTSSV